MWLTPRRAVWRTQDPFVSLRAARRPSAFLDRRHRGASRACFDPWRGVAALRALALPSATCGPPPAGQCGALKGEPSPLEGLLAITAFSLSHTPCSRARAHAPLMRVARGATACFALGALSAHVAHHPPGSAAYSRGGAAHWRAACYHRLLSRIFRTAAATNNLGSPTITPFFTSS